jgi:ABC-type branched-subunit amino acid transport system ATPase component/branched-subunit amino acid ABC-type transport system permease component
VIQAINSIFGSTMPDVAGDAGVSPPGIGPAPPTTWSISDGIAINSDQLAVLAAAAIAALGLWFLIRHTRLGLETRAGVDRPVLARLRGIDTDRSSRIIWALSTLLAGCAGVLIAPLFDLSAITFHMIVFTSFTAAVAARLKSVPLAFAAGLALGVVQNLVHGYAPDFLKAISGFRSSVPFILLFVLLFFVQGRDGRAAGSVAEDAPGEDPLADMSPWRRRAPWILAGSLLCAYALLVANGYWIGILNRGLVLSLVFLSLVVVTGIGGMINLAQATFVTVGGFTAGWLVNHQWPSTVPVLMDNGRLVFWLAIVVAVVVASAVGLLVALPSIRLGGLTLALATLALAFIGDRLVFQLEGVRNGSRGWSLSAPKLGPFDLAQDRTMFIALALIVLACIWIVGNLGRSATGRALLALRSSPEAAAASGVDPTRTKLVLFAVSAGLAGFAGAWFAVVNSPITNFSAPPMLGLIWLAVAVTFGIRRPGGAVLGGIVYSVLPVVLLGIGGDWGAPWDALPDGVRQIIASAEIASLLFGLGAIMLAREPDGVLAQTTKGIRERRLAKAARKRDETVVDSGQQETEAVTPGKPCETGGNGASPILELRAACAGYGEVEVLHGVSLEVMPGEVIAVLGANGAGKSTLCGMITGTVELRSGRILLDGTDISDTPVHMRARQGVVLAPEARGIFPGLSVEDNLAVTLRTEPTRERAKLRFPILAERHKQTAELLSGGEQQQLTMAAILADPPRIFLADEPSLGLSPMATTSVFEALAEMKELGTTLILIEEQAGSALELADRVVVMDLGRITWSGPAHEVDRERLEAAYLGR